MFRPFNGARLGLGLVIGWTAFAAAPTAHPAAPTITVVMSGLDNPRGLAMGPFGGIYVAEAGRGGSGPCQLLAPVNQVRCYGPSGAISLLWRGHQYRVVTGLPSHANAAGEANGPNDIEFDGWRGAYVTIGLGGTPADRDGFGPDAHLLGTLIHIPFIGHTRIAGDPTAYEAASNPGGGPVDSNVYGLLVRPGARIVTDAGGNVVLRVAPNGDISTLGVLPARAQGRSTDAVPTTVVRGPDGAYYVGELSGAPFAAGAARVYRLVPGGEPTVVLEGFKTIVDMAFGSDGSLYVLEHATGPVFFGGPGQVIRVKPDRTRSVVAGGFIRPTSLLVDGRTIYVTNNTVTPGVGEVLRIDR